jgi:hypothetical protein
MGRRGHEPALLPRNGAGESFVSFIALFDRAVPYASILRESYTTPRPSFRSTAPIGHRALVAVTEGRRFRPRAGRRGRGNPATSSRRYWARRPWEPRPQDDNVRLVAVT